MEGTLVLMPGAALTVLKILVQTVPDETAPVGATSVWGFWFKPLQCFCPDPHTLPSTLLRLRLK